MPVIYYKYKLRTRSDLKKYACSLKNIATNNCTVLKVNTLTYTTPSITNYIPTTTRNSSAYIKLNKRLILLRYILEARYLQETNN